MKVILCLLKKKMGLAVLQFQETALNNAFILSANFKSLLARVCSRFAAEPKVVKSRPVTFPNSPGVQTPNSKISPAAIPQTNCVLSVSLHEIQ